MNAFPRHFSARYRLARVGDALLLPGGLVLWYGTLNAGLARTANGDLHRHPGLFVSALLMIVVARSALKIEQALRTPELYKWDLERFLRRTVLLIVMGLAVRLLG
jgi:hypothetical protein